MKPRTISQNSALHLGCQQIADELVSHGIPLDIALKGLDVRPTMESIKSIYRQIAKTKFEVDSTADLETHQINQVWDDLCKALSENTHVTFNFPSQESQQEYLDSLDDTAKNILL